MFPTPDRLEKCRNFEKLRRRTDDSQMQNLRLSRTSGSKLPAPFSRVAQSGPRGKRFNPCALACVQMHMDKFSWSLACADGDEVKWDVVTVSIGIPQDDSEAFFDLSRQAIKGSNRADDYPWVGRRSCHRGCRGERGVEGHIDNPSTEHRILESLP